MSKQMPPSLTPLVYRIAISSTLPQRAQAILAQLPHIGLNKPLHLQIQELYFVEGTLTLPEIERLAGLICDPVTDRFEWRTQTDRVAAFNHAGVIEVTWRPGVTDNVAAQLLRAAQEIGVEGVCAVATGQRYLFEGDLTGAELHQIARTLLVNDTVQRYHLGEIQPEFVQRLSSGPTHASRPTPEHITLLGLDAEGLVEVSRQRRLALDLAEMQAIQAYFSSQERNPSDAELETLAQTWSEHCVHKTFKALIHLADGSQVDGLLRATIMAATRQINAPWVRSAFVDNAGVIAFDEDYDLSFKVETHNHPSAIEPFGGANTGVGGVVRDVLGVSHRPIATTDVLCFGPTSLPYSDLPAGVLHPRRIQAGVIAGVGDYGNKLGLATINGAVLYHPGYTANPLVFCGCLGIGPRDAHPRQAQPGDRVIVIGGRTGRDGLRGATFSSLTMDAQTGQVAGASVQIGDPITEKGVMEVVVRARDTRLYHAITDCGAGGLSSAVGEMSSDLGVQVDLSRVPLKYAGLEAWEIWLSEAQERMVLAVPPVSVPALQALCDLYEVELSDIGEFVASGRLQVCDDDIPVVDLSNEFLHHGIPRQTLAAQPAPPLAEPATIPDGPAFDAPALLLALLSHPDIASKEEVIRRYDHEVRGATVVKPLAGPAQAGPSDAAVCKPLETAGWRGFVLANGINPFLGEVDPYAMAWSVVDEAIRNAVAVGADPQRLALLDNFCWGNPRRPETLGSLVRAAQGCHDAAVAFGTPFISGKDSLNNEYIGSDGQRHAIPGTLLISSLALIPDIRQAVTMDLKSDGSLLYLVGDFQPALAGSHARLVAPLSFFSSTGAKDALMQPPAPPQRAPRVYRALHTAMRAGLVRSAHDLSEGGLAVAAAEMVLAGQMGLSLDLASLHADPALALFGETNGCLLVEVALENQAAFEACFNADASASLPLALLGETRPEPALQISHPAQPRLNLTVRDLLAAFIPVETEL